MVLTSKWGRIQPEIQIWHVQVTWWCVTVRELPKDVLKMASGLISPSGWPGHRSQLCIGRLHVCYISSCWGTHFLYLSNPPSASFLPIIPWVTITISSWHVITGDRRAQTFPPSVAAQRQVLSVQTWPPDIYTLQGLYSISGRYEPGGKCTSNLSSHQISWINGHEIGN